MLATPLAAAFNSAIIFFFPSISSYTGLKSLSTSTERFFFGRSFTCPSEAFTTNCLPRYLPIVFAFAGDSTMTRDFAIEFLNRKSAYGYMLVDQSAKVLPHSTSVRGLPHFNKVLAGELARQT